MKYALPTISYCCTQGILGLLLLVLLLGSAFPALAQNNSAPVGDNFLEGVQATNAVNNANGVQGGRGNIFEGINDRSTFNDLEAFGGAGPTISNILPNAVVDTGVVDENGNPVTEATSAFSSGDQGVNTQTPVNPLVAREGVSGWLYGIMITIGGGFTWIGGGILDYAIDVLVIEMGELLSANIGVAVDNTWKIVRDLFNIVFIFVLVYIGLRTILDADDSQVQKTLGGLIIAALLINFSLFITKTIVDFSNIAAVQIYNAFSIPNGSGTWSGIPTFSGEAAVIGGTANTDHSVSVAFVHSMKLSSFAGQLQVEEGTWSIIFFGFLMMLVLIIAGFVFLAGGVLLIQRFVLLIIFMIFSPVMFLGLIYPGFAKWGKLWWDKFLASAFVAPAYLFMLYICLAVFQGLTPSGTFASGTRAESLANGSFAIFLYFGVMVAFLIAATRVGTLMGAYGASTVMKVGETGSNALRGMAYSAGRGGLRLGGAATAGLLARAGRNTIGQAAHAIANKDGLLDAASERNTRGMFARGLLKSSRVVADSSFDARRVGNVGKNLGIGEGRKGGYKSVEDEIKKKEQGFGKSFGEIDDDDYEMQNRIKAVEEAKQEVRLKKAAYDKLKRENAEADEIAEAEKALDDARENVKKREAEKTQEKYRRQIGRAGVAESVASLQKEVEAQDALMKQKKAYLEEITVAETLMDAEKRKERKERYEAYKAEKDKLAEKRKEVKEKTGTLGYAGVLEKRDFWGSAFYARVNAQDKNAGKEIRKQYEKMSKQSKEDKNTQSIVDSVKSSAK